MDIIAVITELNGLGYSLAVDGDKITYEFVNDRQLDAKRASELLDIIRANREEAVRCLTGENWFAFVPTEDTADAPYKTAVVGRREFLKVLADVLTRCGADTGIIQEFDKRLREARRCGVEYPVMVRADGCVYSLLSEDKLTQYAKSGKVRFRRYTKFGCMTMIFKA
jgi:hypothetical protein